MEEYKTEMLDVASLTGDTLEVTFVVVVPGGLERRFPMRSATMRLGRSDQVDITAKEPSVSSRHLDFVKADGRLYVRDLGSSNGTFLNGERIQEAELQDGDVLRVGSAVTVAVEAGGAARQAPAPMAEPEAVPGSTVMISAADVHQQMPAAPPAQVPTPRPHRIPSPPPMAHAPVQPGYPRAPMHPAPPAGGGRRNLLIAAAVGTVVLLAGGLGVFFLLQGRARAADREVVALVEREAGAIAQVNPCTAVQDSVATLIRLGQSGGVSTPTLPVRSNQRGGYEKYVDLQRDTARQYKRIIGTLEQMTATSKMTVERVRSDLGRLKDKRLKALAAGVTEALDAHAGAGEDFIGGWRRLQRETDTYADLVEDVFLRGNRSAARDYEEHRMQLKPPQVIKACRTAHDEARRNLEERVAALVAAAR